jgi:hypothetical protein
MDSADIEQHLERIVTDPEASAVTKLRALESIMRIRKEQPAESRRERDLARFLDELGDGETS